MRDRQEGSASTHSPDRRGLAFVVAGAIALTAFGLAAFGGTGSSHAASLGKRSGDGNRSRAGAALRAKDGSTALLDTWAACERAHGDAGQADPTVEHQVIYIAVRMGALPGGESNDACSGYLATAQRAVAGGQPVGGWGDDAKYVAYANCMRANGYPTFPYPSGVEPDGHSRTNFNGTGIDPLSPAFLNGHANQMCGKQIGAPAWWINSWGPPGSVDVYPAGGSPNDPLPIGPPANRANKPIAVPGVIGCPSGNGLSGANEPKTLSAAVS
jgi:hypothetical protein